MSTFKITPQATTPRIGAGNSLATIVGVTETLSQAKNLQIKVDFKDADGRTLSHWYNTVGYAKNADKTYKLDSKGNKKITDEDSTEVQKILGKLMAHAGLDTEQECLVTDMIDCEVGIIVVSEVATEGASTGKSFARVKTSYDPATPPVVAEVTEEPAF